MSVLIQNKIIEPALAVIKQRLEEGGALLPDSPDNLLEVVGILKSYGVILGEYYRNLTYVSENQFLVVFPFFKFFNGKFSLSKLGRHWWHDRINFEFAEYCMKAMFWHGTGGLDAYLDSDAFAANCAAIIGRKTRRDPMLALLHPLFPNFLQELIRSAATTHALGQFWRVMSDLFLDLARAEKDGQVSTVAAVVDFLRQGLVAAAAEPISYGVELAGERFWVLPPEAGLTFLADVAVPYVEAVFLRGMPFLGTVSFNAQAQQISPDQSTFTYGALFADPLPSMGAGIPPSLLMQDMYRHLPKRLHQWYLQTSRGEGDVRVKICLSFQKSMFCVTNAAIAGTFPFQLDNPDADAQAANRAYAASWAARLSSSRTDCLDPCDL
jgi:CO2 hydration protein